MFISDLTVLFNSFFCGGLCVCWKTANLICFQINFKNWGTAKCVCVYIYIKYSVFSYVCSACKQYLEKYPEDHNLLWEVEGAGCWFQRTSIISKWQKEKLKIAGMDALFCCFLSLLQSWINTLQVQQRLLWILPMETSRKIFICPEICEMIFGMVNCYIKAL